MTLLHDDAQGKSREQPANMKLLSFKGKYSPAEEVIMLVKNLVRKFGDFTAVDKTNFEVRCGEVFGLLESNCAGKIMTFQILFGLLPMPDVF